MPTPSAKSNDPDSSDSTRPAEGSPSAVLVWSPIIHSVRDSARETTNEEADSCLRLFVLEPDP